MSEGKSYRFLFINQYFEKIWHYSVTSKIVYPPTEIDILLLAITLIFSMCTQKTNKNVLSHIFVIGKKHANQMKIKNSNNNMEACYRMMVRDILE